MANLNPTHRGVLVPDDMLNASEHELDAYAASVKSANRAFITAYYALEAEADRLGVELDAS